MEEIGSPAQAQAKVFGDMQSIVSRVRQLSSQDVNDVGQGSLLLRKIRLSIYEDLNQTQHEYLILQGLQWMLENGFGSPEVVWQWNPRQTGSGDEPDLRGSLNGEILVSAEASASEEPKGSLDERMRKTLEKLSRMEGKKFYIVCADAMATRAQTKVRKADWQIRVVRV